MILSAAITACQLGQQPQMARQLLKTARRQGIFPDVQAYTAAITACGTASGLMFQGRMVVYGHLHRILGEFPRVSVYFHLKWKMWKEDLHRRIFLGMGSSQQPVGGRQLVRLRVGYMLHADILPGFKGTMIALWLI